MSDTCGDNRLIDYSPEYKEKFGDYRDACGVFADVCTDELPEVTLRRLRDNQEDLDPEVSKVINENFTELINFDPPVKE